MKKKNMASIDTETYRKMRAADEKNPEYKKAYAAEKLLYEIAEGLHEERLKHNFTQKQLAEKSGLKQQEISRLEKGDANSTIKMLNKVAQGMGKKLVIKIV